MTKFQYINKKFLLPTLLLSIIFYHAHSQNMIPVDLNTGTATVSVPLYLLQENDLSLPISIYYNTTGLKVNKPGDFSYARYGWNLQAAGQVSRVVRDLPDDYLSTGANAMFGWLNYSTPLFSVNNPPSCSDENTYYGNLNAGSFDYKHDTEPDLFSFSCGGISGQFVIDRDGTVRTIPYQDVRITYIKNASSAITGFVISNNRGYTFQFNAITSSTTLQNPQVYGSALGTVYDARPYKQALNGLTYTTTWGLTEMDSPGGSKITFTYDTSILPVESLSVHGITYQTTVPQDTSFNANYIKQNFYNVDIQTTTYPLLYAQSSTKQVNFGTTGISIYNKTSSGTLDRIKIMNFYGTGLTISGDIDCASNPIGGYKFDYYNGNTDFPANTNSIDFWGFFNNRNNTSLIPKTYVYYNLTGSDRYRLDPIPGNSQYYVLNGSDRTANPDVVMKGSLKQITYPTGNITRFEYESNEYYDETTQTSFKGGGIRVKKITYSEGSGNSPDMIKTYTYAPNSGRLIYKPTFAYPTAFYTDFNNGGTPTYTPSSQTGFAHWNFFTARSETDLSPEEEYNGTYVYYLSAKETELGKGSTQNDYLIPAEYGKTSDSPDWTASYSFIARQTSCFDIGVVTPGYYTFPYPPNTNFSFERGLISKQTVYNDAGQTLKEKYYTYQRVNPAANPVYITGMRSVTITNGSNAYTAFSPYTILTNTTKLQSTVREVTYDPTNLSQSTETTASDFYDSPNHKLLSRTTTLIKDGSVYTTKNKYPLDFAISGTPADDNTGIIKSFQSLTNANYMTGILIEKTSSLQKPGQADMVIGSSLSKFKTFTVLAPDHTIPSVNVPLPYQQLSLAIAAPVSDFTPAAITGGTTLTTDTRYRTMQTIEEYDSKGNITSASNNQRVRKGAHYDITETMPVLQVNNASARQVAYSGFETISTNSFIYDSDGSNPIPASSGRTGNNCLNLAANKVLKQTVSKGPGQNYIFSCWIQSTTSGTMALTVTDGTTTLNYPVAYAVSSGWAYYQQVIPVTSLGATITAFLSTNTAVNIDDVVFFPANSNISYYTYNKYGKTSETNANGITKFYQYDNNGALHYILDADQNIIQRNIYNFKSAVSLAVQPVLTDNVYPSGNKVGDNITFTIANLTAFSCLPGTITYAWDFGDGTTTGASSSVPQTHTYTHYGKYTYSITVTSSVYGSQKTYGNVTINQADYSVAVCNSSGPLVTILCPSVQPYQWDNCNTSHVGSVGTNTFTASILNPYDATACPITYHYTWYTAPLGTTNWVAQPQANDMTSLTVTIGNPSAPQISDSYTVRCDVTVLFPCPAALITPLYNPATATATTVFIQKSPNNTPPCP